MSAVIFPHVGEMAGSALRALPTNGKKMPALTVSFPSVGSGRTVSARVVSLARHKFHMRPSNARMVAAEMIAFAIRRAVGHSEVVSPDNSPTSQIKLSVSVRLESRGPDPTRSKLGAMLRDRSVLIDFAPEALGRRSWSRPHALNFTTEGRCKPRSYARRNPTERRRSRSG